MPTQLFSGLAGPLDLPAIETLRQRLAAMPPQAQVIIDIGKLQPQCDKLLFALVQALPVGGPQIKLRGLNDHQHRLLRYLGYAVTVEPSAESWTEANP